ncbi:hypothetical protein KM043_013649 [Ampulex compressa]|nr:hypothetical protein KM043_013649 [Ampulex compressa]
MCCICPGENRSQEREELSRLRTRRIASVVAEVHRGEAVTRSGCSEPHRQASSQVSAVVLVGVDAGPAMGSRAARGDGIRQAAATGRGNIRAALWKRERYERRWKNARRSLQSHNIPEGKRDP